MNSRKRLTPSRHGAEQLVARAACRHLELQDDEREHQLQRRCPSRPSASSRRAGSANTAATMAMKHSAPAAARTAGIDHVLRQVAETPASTSASAAAANRERSAGHLGPILAAGDRMSRSDVTPRSRARADRGAGGASPIVTACASTRALRRAVRRARVQLQDRVARVAPDRPACHSTRPAPGSMRIVQRARVRRRAASRRGRSARRRCRDEPGARRRDASPVRGAGAAAIVVDDPRVAALARDHRAELLQRRARGERRRARARAPACSSPRPARRSIRAASVVAELDQVRRTAPFEHIDALARSRARCPPHVRAAHPSAVSSASFVSPTRRRWPPSTRPAPARRPRTS